MFELLTSRTSQAIDQKCPMTKHECGLGVLPAWHSCYWPSEKTLSWRLMAFRGDSRYCAGLPSRFSLPEGASMFSQVEVQFGIMPHGMVFPSDSNCIRNIQRINSFGDPFNSVVKNREQFSPLRPVVAGKGLILSASLPWRPVTDHFVHCATAHPSAERPRPLFRFNPRCKLSTLRCTFV